jgi:uncharacterized protein YqgC (DUF456 family)
MASPLIWALTLALFGLGLVGIFIPLVPGIGLIFAGILLFAYSTGFVDITLPTVLWAGGLALAAWLADVYGGALGARLGGGGRFATAGALAGALIGLFVGGPFGVIIGGLLGALAGALYEGHSPARAGRIAASAVVGALGAVIVQFIVGLTLIGLFLGALWR